MEIIAIFERPGMTQSMYEQVATKVAGGHGLVSKPADWPVPGIISHTAAPTPHGWVVVEVWESEEALQRFVEIITPILREVGAPQVEPKIYPVFNLVTS